MGQHEEEKDTPWRRSMCKGRRNERLVHGGSRGCKVTGYGLCVGISCVGRNSRR